MNEKTNPTTRTTKFKAPVNVSDMGREFVDVDLNTYDYEPSRGLAINIKRVIRGGGWNHAPYFLRSARRNGFMPGGGSHYFGFRLVLQTKQKK